MIYLIIGGNKKALEKRKELYSKFPAWPIKKISQEDFSRQVLEGWLLEDSLFGDKNLFCLDNICQNENGFTFILEKIEDLASSDRSFIWCEDKLETKIKNILKGMKAGVEIIDCSETSGMDKSYNFFPFLDALGGRNKKQLWILYQEALLSNSDAEELFWKMKDFFKNIYIIKTVKDKDKLGFKPFFIKKMSAFANNFSEEEIKELFNKLLNIYFHSLNESKRLEKELELFILKL